MKEFLRVAGIPIRPDGIRTPEPPSPDVLCTLTDGTQIAFELTQAVDPRLVRNISFGTNVKLEMRNYFENMPSPDRNKITQIFHNADLFVHFNDDTSKSGFRQLLPKLFLLFLKCASGMEGDIERDLLPAGVKRIRIARGEFLGPMFNASGLALYVANTTIKRIMVKFSKQYECNCPIELLVHSRTHRLQPDLLRLQHVQDFVVRELTRSPFRRVWIFDYTSSTITYVYP